jgi:hypothetical protein
MGRSIGRMRFAVEPHSGRAMLDCVICISLTFALAAIAVPAGSGAGCKTIKQITIPE